MYDHFELEHIASRLAKIAHDKLPPNQVNTQEEAVTYALGLYDAILTKLVEDHQAAADEEEKQRQQTPSVGGGAYVVPRNRPLPGQGDWQ